MPTSIIEQIQAYNQATFDLEVAIMSNLYSYREVKTLEDIEFNLECLRRLTHLKIELRFNEVKYLNFYIDFGILLIDRNARATEYRVGYDPYYIEAPNKGVAIVTNKFIPPNPTA
jgi:hypothetical protein